MGQYTVLDPIVIGLGNPACADKMLAERGLPEHTEKAEASYARGIAYVEAANANWPIGLLTGCSRNAGCVDNYRGHHLRSLLVVYI